MKPLRDLMVLTRSSSLTGFRFAGTMLRTSAVEVDKMRFERKSVLAFFSSAFAALLSVSDANAALVFQDRHPGANGEETIYRFEAKAASTASPIDQSKAVKVATVWAAQYYGISNLTVTKAQERSMPIHYWLIAFTVPGQSKAGTYYSIVLPDGAVVVPKVSREGNLTVSANPIDVTKDTELTAPAKGLEIHGEVIFEYGWGKGLGCYGPYAPNPLRDVAPPIARPAP
jgi:hypothetical protein